MSTVPGDETQRRMLRRQRFATPPGTSTTTHLKGANPAAGIRRQTAPTHGVSSTPPLQPRTRIIKKRKATVVATSLYEPLGGVAAVERRSAPTDMGPGCKRPRTATGQPAPVVGGEGRERRVVKIPFLPFNGFGTEKTTGAVNEAALVGTSRSLEKEYLRLTTAPVASAIRPVHILKVALQHVKDQWLVGRTYTWVCSQLKSIRQDLTVQRVKTAFVVKVYETHARIALETSDWDEFTACQTQLKQLYNKGIAGHASEFTAYRILHAAVRTSRRGGFNMQSVLRDLSAEQRQQADIAHALRVVTAVVTRNFYSFFKLYRCAPNMSGYLMDPLAGTMRTLGLQALYAAHKPTVPVDFVGRVLALEPEACTDYLQLHGAVYTDGTATTIDTKLSSEAFSDARARLAAAEEEDSPADGPEAARSRSPWSQLFAAGSYMSKLGVGSAPTSKQSKRSIKLDRALASAVGKRRSKLNKVKAEIQALATEIQGGLLSKAAKAEAKRRLRKKKRQLHRMQAT